MWDTKPTVLMPLILRIADDPLDGTQEEVRAEGGGWVG